MPGPDLPAEDLYRSNPEGTRYCNIRWYGTGHARTRRTRRYDMCWKDNTRPLDVHTIFSLRPFVQVLNAALHDFVRISSIFSQLCSQSNAILRVVTGNTWIQCYYEVSESDTEDDGDTEEVVNEKGPL